MKKIVAPSAKQVQIINEMFPDCWWVRRYMRMSIVENRIAGNFCKKVK